MLITTNRAHPLSWPGTSTSTLPAVLPLTSSDGQIFRGLSQASMRERHPHDHCSIVAGSLIGSSPGDRLKL
jgi:hypothetical protein